MLPMLQAWIDSGGTFISRSDAAPGKAAVTQLFCLQQQPGDISCGHFCLHNLECLLCSGLGDSNAALKACQDMRERDVFVDRQQALNDILLHEGRRRGAMSPPWAEAHIRTGVLERPHLEYLLEAGHIAHSEAVECVLEASASASVSNELPLSALAAFDTQLARLQASSTPRAAALVVGATIHWTIVVVTTDGASSMEVVYCDSQNRDIVGKNAVDLLELTKACEFKAWLKAGWKRETMEGLQLDSWGGMQYVVEAIRVSAMGGRTLQLQFVDRWLREGLLSAWQRSAGDLAMFIDDGWHMSFLEVALPPIAHVAVQDESLRILLANWSIEAQRLGASTSGDKGGRLSVVAGSIEKLVGRNA